MQKNTREGDIADFIGLQNHWFSENSENGGHDPEFVVDDAACPVQPVVESLFGVMTWRLKSNTLSLRNTYGNVLSDAWICLSEGSFASPFC